MRAPARACNNLIDQFKYLQRWVAPVSFTFFTEGTELLQKLSLDSQTNTLEAAEATKTVNVKVCSVNFLQTLNDIFHLLSVEFLKS